MPSVIDIRSVMLRFGFDAELLREIATMFGEDAPVRLDELQTAVEHEDRSAVRLAAHALRGMAANFGAERAVRAAARVEELATRSDWPSIVEAIEPLRATIDELLSNLSPYMSGVRVHGVRH